jgi:8-oxo-dGTP pyrophosphatase MutT (NUDIX family)
LPVAGEPGATVQPAVVEQYIALSGSKVEVGRAMDGLPYRFPVSVKGVVVRDGCVLLLRNERDEWELPGGKLDLGEKPEDCVAREVHEEVGWSVAVGPLLDAWQYHIRDGVDVLIITYGCRAVGTDPPVISDEHNQIGIFTEDEAASLPMPEGYKRSITAWCAQLAARVE